MQNEVKNNALSALTVTLLSLPLSCALATMSGVEPINGIISSIYGPIAGGFFGDSDFNVLGPAGALIASAVLNKKSSEYGPEIIPLLAFCSGFAILILHFVKAHIVFEAIPDSVI